MIFGLYSLTILTASPVSNQGTISGLTKDTAARFQAYLLALVETTLPDVKEKAAVEVVTRKHTPEEADAIIHGKDGGGEKGAKDEDSQSA